MAEQTFRSPGFFEREIDLSAREAEPTGTPAGVGPVTIGDKLEGFQDGEKMFEVKIK